MFRRTDVVLMQEAAPKQRIFVALGVHYRIKLVGQATISPGPSGIRPEIARIFKIILGVLLNIITQGSAGKLMLRGAGC